MAAEKPNSQLNKMQKAENRRKAMRHMVGIAKLSPGEDLKTLKDERLSKLKF